MTAILAIEPPSPTFQEHLFPTEPEVSEDWVFMAHNLL
jgi:hypothetical protein